MPHSPVRGGLFPGGAVPAPLLVGGAIVSVQTGGGLAKNLFERTGPTGAVFLRLVFAAVVLVVATRPTAAVWTGRGQARGQRRALAGYAACLLAMNWSFYEALSRLPLGVAVTFEFMGPLTVAIVGSRRLLDLVWAALAAGGVVLLTGDGAERVTATGVGLALLAGAFWAGYILLGARVGAAPGLSALAVALTVAAVGAAPFGVALAGSRLLAPAALLGGLTVAVLSSAVPYSLELAALRRIPTAVFGVLMSLEPAAAALIGLIVLGERLGAREVSAIALVSAASAGATLGRRRPPVTDVP